MLFLSAELLKEVDSSKWPARTTNTAGALATALDVLSGGGRSTAQSGVFVLTDGMPNDVEATAMMAEKVKKVARLVFVAVGKNLDKDALYGWASFPPEQNVLTAKKFRQLKKKVGTFLSDLCPQLKCDESLEGNGEDYIGCQSVTVTGKTCQAWNEKFPHKHKFTGRARKMKNGLGKHNFCRNPDNEDTKIGRAHV